ncbi:thiamine-phosphate kinase [Halalkalibacter urbisdiaboli]|uniref:thiamine-phosphate kinase n=1 Tax=Halalkalibacter urbisdiaboli TaxID=1960589 RepID=UPI000B439A85|nr:thiamine-phosphate kinase [Halalkalibacter urbisdiaboli]
MKDEFAFIERVKPSVTYQSSLVMGIGDDAAVYRGTSDMDDVVCVDTMVEGVHFRRDTLSPQQIGKKALAVNVSDLAAMGASPLYYLVSIAIPPSWEEEDLTEVYQGMHDLAKEYQMDLIGGDTVSTTDALVITVTVIGRVERDRKLFRNQAKAGDIVFVTGNIGGSAAGLHLLFKKGLKGQYSSEEQQLVLTHQEPMPQVKAGRIFAGSFLRISLNDISDGIASEANELAEASNVQIILNLEKLPLHPAMRFYSMEKQLEWALFGGEDFQLIGTIAEENFSLIKNACSVAGIKLTAIGQVECGSPSVIARQGEEVFQLDKKGYNHFRRG